MVINIPPEVNRVFEILLPRGYDSYVVGGAVRDALAGGSPEDWDVATSAAPDEILNAFSEFKTIETGIKHGTVSVFIGGMKIEITSFRTESGYSDNRRPDKVSFSRRIEDDLSRRDFTVNAVAYSPKSGFLDLFGGIKDVERKIIRCVGNADERFGEDALRILRALRFSSVLGFDMASETSESVHKNYALLKNVSAERIFSELTKLLCGKNVGKILSEYDDAIFFVLPELAPAKGCPQNCERHVYDVWNHTIAAVKNVAAVPELRFAALFHDSGKPLRRTTDENGADHFYSHGKAGRDAAFGALSRLRASNKFKDRVCALVEFHDFLPDKISKKTYKKYIARLGRDVVRELFELRKADVSAQNPKYLKQSLLANEAGEKILDEIDAENSCLSLGDLAVGGAELMELGFKPSPEMGEALNVLLEEVVEEKIENAKEALIKRAAELKNRRKES